MESLLIQTKFNSESLHSSASKVHFATDFQRKNSVIQAPKFSVDEVLRRRSTKSLHSQHNKAIEKSNNDDYDHDLLLGNLSKSIYFKKNLDRKLQRQKSSKEPLSTKNDPYTLEIPADFIKQPCSYNKNFKEAFASFLKGEIDMETLQTLKNFPNVYKFDSESKRISPVKKLQMARQFTISGINNNVEKNLNFNSNQEKSIEKKGNYYDIMRKIVMDRILYKKKIKNEGLQYRTFNSKFLENFYSINKNYAEKIENKDLLAVNNSKKYYNKSDVSTSKILNGFSLRGITKKAGNKKL